MVKGSPKAYPRFQADTDILSLTDFIEAFARKDSSIPLESFLSFVPIDFGRILEIAVEQNRDSIMEGTTTDLRMRGRAVLEAAIIETGTVSGAQWMIDWQLKKGIIEKAEWNNCFDQIAVSFDDILFNYASKSAGFLRALENNIGRKGKRGRPKVVDAASSLRGLIDSGLVCEAAQPTREDPENSLDATLRRLRPIVRSAIQRGVLRRSLEIHGQSCQEAVDTHTRRLARLAKSITAAHQAKQKA